MFPITHYAERIDAIDRLYQNRATLGLESRPFLRRLLEVNDKSTSNEELIRRAAKQLNDALTIERVTKRLTS